jgi:cytochrome c oxidase cbb3-type subunit 3
MSEKKDSETKVNEEHRLEGHTYDGIEELDHPLPKWWTNLFYLTIFFSLGYFAYYGTGEGPSLLEEYQQHQHQLELTELAQLAKMKVLTEPELRAFLKEPTRLKNGQGIFQTRCASCHGAEGQGGIGPNLTDEYWIHGGKMTDILQVVTKGVLDKGMPPWGGVLSQDELHSVVAFVKSLKGTHPPNPKAPQGEIFKE